MKSVRSGWDSDGKKNSVTILENFAMSRCDAFGARGGFSWRADDGCLLDGMQRGRITGSSSGSSVISRG